MEYEKLTFTVYNYKSAWNVIKMLLDLNLDNHYDLMILNDCDIYFVVEIQNLTVYQFCLLKQFFVKNNIDMNFI